MTWHTGPSQPLGYGLGAFVLLAKIYYRGKFMPSFSKQSSDKLATCDPRLQKIFNHVIQFIDFRITEGHRDKADQDKAFANGNSKLKWPKGKHNSLPSKAVDALILPVDFDINKPRNLARYYYFAGFVMATAAAMNIRLKFGGDWDSDFDLNEERFLDLVHFELVDKDV